MAARATLDAILTWPAYGTWLPGPSHGWIESCGGADLALPEPDRALGHARRKRLKWPAVQLSHAQREVVRSDLSRVAAIRSLLVRRAIVDEDHIHVLMSTNASDDAALHRLIQLIKGALSRALSVAAGDEPARAIDGAPLPHHKWWSRQYVFQRLHDQAALRRAVQLFEAHLPEAEHA